MRSGGCKADNLKCCKMDIIDIFVYGLMTLIVAILFVVIFKNVRHNARMANLWDDYQKALASGDKEKALAAGRAYYALYRRGAPSRASDEVAIANDINKMR